LRLQGIVFRPEGKGPVPAVVYNHGSDKDPTEAIEILGPAFASRGWVLFAPYRRGQGLSAAEGPFIGDEIAAARTTGGLPAASTKMIQGFAPIT
jgi:carboxymethylenebutenolidase